MNNLCDISDYQIAIYIPTYNRASSLSRSIRSALEQTHKNIRVYVSDNASTDDTYIVCNQYSGDNRFVYKRYEYNRGPEKNFEDLYSSSNEPWLMFLADDDYIDKDYVEKCLLFALKNECVCVGGSAVNYADGQVYSTDSPFVLKDRNPLLRLFCFINIPNTNAVFYGVHKRSRFSFRGNIFGDDWRITYNRIIEGNVAVIDYTHIHRDMTRWKIENIEKTLYKVFIDAGFTDMMIQEFKHEISIIEKITQIFETLNTKIFDDDIKSFIVIAFYVFWDNYFLKINKIPKLDEFVNKTISSVSTDRTNVSISRYMRLKEFLNDEYLLENYIYGDELKKIKTNNRDATQFVREILWKILLLVASKNSRGNFFYGKILYSLTDVAKKKFTRVCFY